MKQIWFIFLLAAIFIGGCSKDKPFPLDPNTGTHPVEISILQPANVDFTFSNRLNLGSAQHLYLGTFRGGEYKSRILLEFVGLPDTVEYQSAQIILYKQAVLEDTVGSFTAQLFQLTSDWDEYEAKQWSEIGADSSTMLAESEINVAVDDSILFNINPGLVAQWADTNDATENNGIWIQPVNAELMVDFYTKIYTASGLAPILHVEYLNDGELESQDIFASKDLSIVTTDFTDLNQDRLQVGKGIAFESYIKFNLDQVPDTNATISKAELRLVVDRSASLLEGYGISSLIAEIVGNDNPSPGNVEIDSLYASYSYSSTVDDTVYFQLRPIFQTWLSFPDEIKNRGLLLGLSNPNESLARISFYSSKADTALAPRVKLVYSLPPNAQ
ncbi:hypothetical protein JW960_15055 [candidate division KSB1 bacterium]|nr:hypothetical protein [candidate division KSB1 bacterium]